MGPTYDQQQLYNAQQFYNRDILDEDNLNMQELGV